MRVAIIPARGGSKRIPRKNIKLFCGKPIIAYSIETAQKTKLFDHVIVSTDDNEIADIARQYGAETPFIRPNILADDFTNTNDVICHAINWLNENRIKPKFTCCLYATSPLLQHQALIDGFERLRNSEKSFAFAVTSFPFPIQRALRLNSRNELEAWWPENIEKRSQDLEESYHDAGQFYWGRTNAFLEQQVVYSNLSIPVILPRHLVQDIDTPEDWERAEMMYQLISNQL